MSVEPGNFCWFECATRDPERTKDFYADLFGWAMTDTPMPDEHGGTYTLIQIDGEDIGGLQEMNGPMFEGVAPHWLSYVAVDDADATARRVERLGGTLMMEPFDVPEVGRMILFQDPMGATIAAFQLTQHPGMGAKSNLGWSELHTTDTARAREFYTQLFGWTAKEDPSGDYTEWQLDGRSIGGMMEIPIERRGFVPPNWLPYAMVDDCDRTLARAAERGARILAPAMDMEQVGRFGIFQDPAGATLAVIRLDEHA